MATEIDQVIFNCFPEELVDALGFEGWCRPIREDAFPEAINLKCLLESKLDQEANKLHAKEKTHRDYWELFGGEGDSLIKSVASIRSKLARDLLAANPKCRTTEELKRMLLGFADLGRIRIVVDYLSDIQWLETALFNENRSILLDRYKCLKGIKDFIFDPKKRDGLKGHRAHQFSVRAPYDDNQDFGFEIQLMTRLQHAWDRRNHPLYEWQRESPIWKEDPAAAELAVNDFACAETLHLVDQQADHNWKQFLEKFGKGDRHEFK